MSHGNNEILEQLREMRAMIERCDVALTGDPQRGIKGLVQNAEDQSSVVSALTKRITRIEIIGIVVLLTIGAQLPSVWHGVLSVIK